MPEIKHNFTGGKMNKDVDERLVPKGQYDHAVNIQVSTSEGAEVGTVQNILGNSMPESAYQVAGIGNDSVCVGSVVDEKNDAFYYLVKSGGEDVDSTSFTSLSPQGADSASRDIIFQYKNETITPVFVAISAPAYTISQTATNISWNSTAGTITLPSPHSVSDLSSGMQLIAFGFDGSGSPIEVSSNYIISIDAGTNTITLFGDLTWLDNSTTTYHFDNTKLFFTNNGSPDFNTILGFTSKNLITGINIVDDMLFWVDGHYDSNGELIGSEPKKINIPRSIAGTIDAFTHTTFINSITGAGTPAQEKHITVIKEKPKMAPSMMLESTKPTASATMGECEISFEDVANNPGELLIPGDALFGVPILHSVTNGLTPGTANNLDVEIGDVMSLEILPDEQSSLSFPLRQPIVTVNVINTYISGIPDANGVFTTLIDLEIVSISTSTPLGPTRFLIDLKLQNNERILKFKFPKFAVRYKYQDNEYSAFSPFTQVAFVPLSWDYQPKKGQNVGMQNHLKQLTLSNIVPDNIPHGVVQVDILYKESGSSNIYLVDQLKPDDGTNQWQSDSYVVDSELIHAVVAENQILRHYDNVPKIARAQEVTGSRIVYGNYKQNYTILNEDASARFDINLVEHNIAQDGTPVPEDTQSPHVWNPNLTTPLRSIKSLREYQLGVVFEDKYGRQSPVMTSSQSTLKVPKKEAKNSNLLEIKNLSNPPVWAESFRFFIKEPSTQYYNLAMDRWYDAEDGNIWLSFPSLDRNKLTEEDTIILKKNINSNVAIEDTSEYKVIAISNEVPDYVKSTKVSYGIEDHASTSLLGSSPPITGSASISVDPAALTSSSSSLIHAFEDWRDSKMVDKRLWIRFRKTTTPQQYSNWYEVSTMDDYMDNAGTIATTPLKIRVNSAFQDDIDFFNVGGGFVSGAALEIARSVDTPYAQFDGRFFVKILKDLNLEQTILTYQFDAGYSVVGMLTPRFLRYDGHWHREDRMTNYGTGSYDIGSLGSKGDYEVWNNSTTSGGWEFPPSVSNPAWYDYNGHTAYVGSSGSYRSDEAFQNPKYTSANSEWAYSRELSTWSHGKNLTGDDRHVNIFPKAYPFMLGAFNGNYSAGSVQVSSCIPNGTVSPYEWSWSVHFLGRAEGGGGGDSGFWETMGQDDNWFIDMEPTWFFPKKNWINGVEEYYATPADNASGTPYGFNNFDGPSADPDIGSDPYRGHRNTPGVGARLGSRRIDISYVGPDYIPTSSSQPGLDFQFNANIETHDFLTAGGSYISFNGDPGMIKYKIVDYRIVEEIANIPDDSNCASGEVYAMLDSNGMPMSYNTTPGLWRVRYELLLDQPIGTTVQDQGIITPTEYILAGGTPDQHNNLGIAFSGDHCCNGVPVYARKYKFYPPSYEAAEDQLNDSLGLPGYNDYSQIGVGTAGFQNSGCYNDQLGISTLPTTQANVKTDCPQLSGAFYDVVDSASNVTGNPGVSIDNTIWTNVDGSTRLGYIPTQNTYTENLGNTSYQGVKTMQHDVAGGNLESIPTPGTGVYAASEEVEGGIINWSIYSSVSVGSEEYESSYNPAIWETIPTDPIDLELYYEASKSYPVNLFKDNNHLQIAPAGSGVVCYNCNAAAVIPSQTTIQLWINNTIYLSQPHSNTLIAGDIIQLTNLDGSYVTVVVDGIPSVNEIQVKPNIYNSDFGLSWHNCFAFGNGVESDRISDTFNSHIIGKGVRVSTVLEKDYEEEHRKHGLIYSGLYNSTSGVNSLNQFIAAEKITKDVNPVYGSIQKLHSRNTDLITLCEDKVLKILANKDAVFNADGNIQLTATGNVLGQTVPFIGEFGISKNPESFASESYRAYFTDKVRGAVVRLSRDGLTPISDAGMKDWFRDHFNLVRPTDNVIGSYDDYKGEYNLTLFKSEATLPSTDKPETLTFREDVKGWVSFKSFTPENAISCANKYYTFSSGYVWKHHSEFDDSGATIPRNQFYGTPKASSISFYLNDFPSIVKSFHTLSYEGSKSRVVENLQDNDYYNLAPKDGWYVQRIETDKEGGTVDEFIEKEGKWFNYIKGDNIPINNCGIMTSNAFDESSFAMQGLGILTEAPVSVLVIEGCTDPTQANYNPAANVDDGSCQPYTYGCIEPTASNYNSAQTADDGSCIWIGCTDPTAFNPTTFPAVAYTYNGGVGTIIDDGSCVPVVLGCTDCGSYWESQNTPNFCNGVSAAFLQGSFNYNPAATNDDGSCIDVQIGCTEQSAYNYTWFPGTPNVDPGYCAWSGCTNEYSIHYGLGALHGAANVGQPFPPEALNYVPYNNFGGYGMIDDGSCLDVGCTDSGTGTYDNTGAGIFASAYGGYQASNYDPSATIDSGLCVWDIGCDISYADNFSPTTPPGSTWVDNSGCVVPGCLQYAAQNYGCNPVASPGSLVTCTDGVTYDDSVTCTYPANPGCTDSTADNYDGPTPIVQDDGSCLYCDLDNAWSLGNETNTTIDVTIDPSLSVAPNTAAVLTAEIKWRVQGTSTWSTHTINPLSGTASTYTITGLSPSTVYQVTITATCDNTASGTSIIQTSTDGLISGCTDSTLNNDGTSAAANYNAFATVDDGSCDPYNCPIVNSSYTLGDGYVLSIDAAATTFATPGDLVVTLTYNTNTITGGIITTALTNIGAPLFDYQWGQIITTTDMSALVNTGDTYITIFADTTTALAIDGSFCPLTNSETMTGGCTDDTVDANGNYVYNYVAYADFDNGSCAPLFPGCTDAAACNYDPSATLDDSSCVYSLMCQDQQVSGTGWNCIPNQGCYQPTTCGFIPGTTTYVGCGTYTGTTAQQDCASNCASNQND
jgi:hypothetical protein